MNASEPKTGFCDSHVHIVGDPARYPLSPDRTYLPGIASLATLDAQGAPLGVTRFVIVQPSFYGTDNSALLEALDTLGDRGRGVAVGDPARTSSEQLGAMAARGVRGLRINLYSGLGGEPEGGLAGAFGRMAALAGDQGWHVEVIAPITTLAETAEPLARSPVPVVIDHYGLYGEETPNSAAGKALLALLAHPHVWMKLSAPYRSGGDELALEPDRAWLDAILDVCPDRCVWGSDWPHTPAHGDQKGPDTPGPYRGLDYRSGLETFRAALPQGIAAESILRDNPARLYGFAD
jgi:predicted TIM-barrel fold metal-dependent hydrolase